MENQDALGKLAKLFNISIPPKITYVFFGEKEALTASATAKRLRLNRKLLEKLDDCQLGTFGLERIPDYRDVFFNQNPGLIPIADRIVVHHAIPKWFLKRHPGLFNAKEINHIDSLRGIYKLTNDELHNDRIHNAWERFNRANPKPSRIDALRMVEKLDNQYGQLFIPTEGR